MWYVGTSTVNLRRVVPQNSGWYIYNRTYELSGKSLNYGIIWCQADHGNFTIVKFIHIEIGFQSSICGTEGRVYQTGMPSKWLGDQGSCAGENWSSNQEGYCEMLFGRHG